LDGALGIYEGGGQEVLNLLDPVKFFASHISIVLFWLWAIVMIWGE
jgi:hypothetical protein